MKNILIFYASYGGGHLSAAKSIKQYIDSHYKDCNVKMCDCMKYIDTKLEKITTDAYKTMAKSAPKTWGELYKLTDREGPITQITNTSNKLFAIKLNKLFKEFNPDIVISTHPFSTQMTAELKKLGKTKCTLATIMTDFAPHNQWLVGSDYIDYFFVSHEGMKKKIMQKGIQEEKIFATGIPLSNRFLQHFNREKIKEDLKLDTEKRTILFFGGGEFGLGKDATSKILEEFILNLKNEYQMVVISGKNEKMYEKFSSIVKQKRASKKVQVYTYTNKVPELMSISDLVVTKPGGLTSTESLASGLPMVIINPIPGQEEKNAKYLVSSGVAIWLKNDDNCEKKIKDLLSNPDELKQMKIKSKLMAKKNSTRDICKIVLGEN